MSVTNFIIWNSLLNNSATNLELPKDWSFLDFILTVGVIAIGGIVLIALGVGIAMLVMAIIDWCSNKYWEHKADK